MTSGEWADVRLESMPKLGTDGATVFQAGYSFQTTRGDCMVELHLQRNGKYPPIAGMALSLHDSRGRKIGWCLTGGERFGSKQEDTSATRYTIRDAGRYLVSVTLTAAARDAATRAAAGRPPRLGWQLSAEPLRGGAMPRPTAPAAGTGTRERPIPIQLAQWVDGLIEPHAPAAGAGEDPNEAVVFERWYALPLKANCVVELCQDRDDRIVGIYWRRNLALLDPRGAEVKFAHSSSGYGFADVPGTHSASGQGGGQIREGGTYLVRVRIHRGDLEYLNNQPAVDLQYRFGVAIERLR